MSIKTRLRRLERADADAFSALDELLASVAARGLRVHERPAGLAGTAPVDRDELTGWFDALSRAPSLPAALREGWA